MFKIKLIAILAALVATICGYMGLDLNRHDEAAEFMKQQKAERTAKFEQQKQEMRNEAADILRRAEQRMGK